MKRKRKEKYSFKPTEALKRRLLELAHVDYKERTASPVSSLASSSSAPEQVRGGSPTNQSGSRRGDSSSLFNDGKSLKRKGDKLQGTKKFCTYIESALMFLEHAAHKQAVAEFKTTAVFLEQCAGTCSNYKKGNKTTNKLDQENSQCLLVLFYKLAAVARMKAYVLQADLLKSLRDDLAKSLKSNSLQMHIDESLDYFLQEIDDVLKAKQLWYKGERLRQDVLKNCDMSKESSSDAVSYNMSCIPEISNFVTEEITTISHRIKLALANFKHTSS